jgi:hypothetical protein
VPVVRHLVRLAIAGCIALVLGTFSWLALPRETLAQSSESCRVGVYVVSLYNFDTEADTFDANLWLWSVCPNQELRPLETMEVVNADAIDVLLDITELRGGLSWANRKIHGTFRHTWDERDFPWDRQRLMIVLEESGKDVRQFVYEPDTANTTYDPAIQLPGWTITDFSVSGGTGTYETTFGDPTLAAGGSSTYSRLTLAVDLARSDLSGFFKLTAVVYAAFGLSLITYVMHLETTTALSPQFQILAAALFAAAVNLVTASAALGRTSQLTLMDRIHIVVLVYILVAAVVVVIARVLVERGWSQTAIAKLNHRIGAVVAVSFLAINAVLIASAVRGG